MVKNQLRRVQYGPSIESLPDSVGQVKACPVKNNDGTEKDRKGVLVVGQLPLEGECTMWLKRLTLEGEIVRNASVSLSPTLTRNEKVEHYIRIKTHKPIALRFWVESDVSVLCG